MATFDTSHAFRPSFTATILKGMADNQSSFHIVAYILFSGKEFT